jgi:tetratricopeptide (TPR) repeat protein
MNDSAARSSFRSARVGALLLFFGVFIAAASFGQSAETYRQQAIELSSLKSWDEAIAAYHRSLELAPNDPLTHYNLALALGHKGDTRQAVEEFQAALQLKPKWADAHYALGATFFELQDQASALKELRAAVTIDPANIPAHRLLARIYMQQNDPVAAGKELRQALRVKPAAELHFELGLVEGQLGSLDAAAIEFRTAIRLNPGFAP